MNFRMSLARVYLLPQPQAFKMFEANQAALKLFMAEGALDHAEKQKANVAAHNELVQAFEAKKEACERSLARIETRMRVLREENTVGSEVELQNLAKERGEEIRRYESLRVEAERLDVSRPKPTAWKPSVEKAVEIMLRPPSGLDYATRSDADGGFSLKTADVRDTYILILPKEPTAKAKWFLKLSAMRKDGDKYLFTEENDVWHSDKAQALELNVTDSSFQFRIR